MSKCTAQEKKAAGEGLSKALVSGSKKYSKGIGRSSAKLTVDAHKSMLPKNVLEYFEKKAKYLTAKYMKVVQAKKVAKAKKAAKVAQNGGAPVKHTPASIKKEMAALESHVKVMEFVKESSLAAKMEIKNTLEKLGARYECLPTVDFSLIGKSARYYTRLHDSAKKMIENDIKKIASLKKQADKLDKAKDAAPKKTTKRVKKTSKA
jgi:hypothetical protein